VDNIDLSIRDQEFVVLVGPSGCGKSTTLRMVAGLEEITDGLIRIGERMSTTCRRSIGHRDGLPELRAVPAHEVYKNMAFGLKLRKMPKPQIHQRVMEAAKILDIEHPAGAQAKALSGGQRQRVAVGRAIVRSRAFLFDERSPTSMRNCASPLARNSSGAFIGSRRRPST